MNIKIFLFLFCLLITSNLFGKIKVESPDKTKIAYLNTKKYLKIKLTNQNEKILIFNFNYVNISLKKLLWSKNSKYLIINTEINTKENQSKYNWIHRLEIKEKNARAKQLNPFKNEKSQIELIETIEKQAKQILKIKIKRQNETEFKTGWIDIETGIFFYN